MKKYILIFLLIAASSCKKSTERLDPPTVNAVDKATVSAPNDCRYSCNVIEIKICETLAVEYKRCDPEKSEAACKAFIKALTEAMPKTAQCNSSCSQGTLNLPIIRSCDSGDIGGGTLTEDSARLLVKLKFAAAQKLLISEDFFNMLDGSLLQEIAPEIEKARAQAAKAP